MNAAGWQGKANREVGCEEPGAQQRGLSSLTKLA